MYEYHNIMIKEYDDLLQQVAKWNVLYILFFIVKNTVLE
jgi:hypothetical protein